MTTYVVELPDVAAWALEQTAQAFAIDPEALIAEAIRALPEFQEALQRQAAIVHSLTQSPSTEGHSNV